jgi:hypothetical protein
MRYKAEFKIREVRAYTLLRNVRGRDAVSALWHGFSSPCTTDDGRSCPSTQTISMEANPARIGWAATACPVASTFRGPLHPRNPQRQDFRVPTPTRSVSPLHHEQEYDSCTTARAVAPRHPRHRAFLPRDPDQPCAGWSRTRALPPWICTRSALPPGPPRHDIRVPTPTTGMALPAVAERFVVRSRAGARPLHPDPARDRAGQRRV